MVWVVSGFRLKVETSSTRAKNQSTVIELTRDLLAGGDLITLGSLQDRLPDSQPAHQLIEYLVLIADRGRKKLCIYVIMFCLSYLATVTLINHSFFIA
jgi:hypothetical protein